jgi:acetolactate synthase I/II/III large subunit
MPKRTAWRAVVDALATEGVERVFGLPGNPLHLVADLENHSSIENVLVRHEHSGAALAYATARVTGRPAVCYGNPGPGITNMATALLEATSASLPVVALANGVPLAADGKGAFQELDSVSLMRPVTKWATRVVAAETVPWVMQRAFSIAKNGRPGAVFIDLPSDLGVTKADIPAYRPSLPRHLSRPEAGVVAAAAKLLAAAKAPLIICGSGAVGAGAAGRIRRLAEQLGMPVFTTPGGRGAFPEGHGLALGQVGLYFTELGKDYFDGADLVLSVGSRLEDFSTGGWQLWPKRAKLIQLDIDPAAIFLNLEPKVALVGDAALALDDLIAALPAVDAAARDRRVALLAGRKARFLARIEAECERRRTPILTRQVVAAINRIFGADTIMVHENGGADLWTYYWPYYRVLDVGGSVPMGEQTAMGMGFIGAIGVKLAQPDKKVVCVGGDGAMQMAMMELATAAEHNCGVTWVVLNNRALGWPQFIQRLESERQVATDFETSPDFAMLAKAQGCKGIKVSDPEKVDGALRSALRANAQGVPALVEVAIAKHDYPRHFVNFHREVWGLGARTKAGKRKKRTMAS